MMGPETIRTRIAAALTRRPSRSVNPAESPDLGLFPEGYVLPPDVPQRLVDAISATPPVARRAGRVLALFLVFGFASILWLPWQQNVGADGQVVALSPELREQTLTAPIKGRAVRWFVQEGERVEAGQPIVELADVDPDYMERLVLRSEAAQARIEAQERQVAMFEAQVVAFREALAITKDAVALRVEAAEQKILAASQKLGASRAGRRAADLQDKRIRQLESEGLSSGRELELAELQRLTAGNQVGMEAAAVSEARANRELARADGIRAVAEADGRVAAAEAALGKARAELASARSDILSVESEIARQTAGLVRAPQRAFVVRLSGQRDGTIYDVGAVLAVLAPETTDRAVALRIAGNDAPIVRVGSRVQLQFEGWPAVFFSGWPDLSSGTFSGLVQAMDAVTQADGSFRALVVPDLERSAWPDPTVLRQGVRVRAWVLGEKVPLGYELWRLFNGFPLELPRVKSPPGPNLVGVDSGVATPTGGAKKK